MRRTQAPHLFEPAQRLNEPSSVHSLYVCSKEETGTDAVAQCSDRPTLTEGGTGIEEASGSAPMAVSSIRRQPFRGQVLVSIGRNHQARSTLWFRTLSRIELMATKSTPTSGGGSAKMLMENAKREERRIEA